MGQPTLVLFAESRVVTPARSTWTVAAPHLTGKLARSSALARLGPDPTPSSHPTSGTCGSGEARGSRWYPCGMANPPGTWRVLWNSGIEKLGDRLWRVQGAIPDSECV